MRTPSIHGITSNDRSLYRQPEQSVINRISLHWSQQHDRTIRVPVQYAKTIRVRIWLSRIFGYVLSAIYRWPKLDFLVILPVDASSDVWRGIEACRRESLQDWIGTEVVVRVMMSHEDGLEGVGSRLSNEFNYTQGIWNQKRWINQDGGLGADDEG